MDSASCFPSDQSGTWCLLYISLSLDNTYQDEEFGTALAYHVPQRFHVHGPIFGGQVVCVHIPWFQTEPLGPPGVCVSLFAVSSIV